MKHLAVGLAAVLITSAAALAQSPPPPPPGAPPGPPPAVSPPPPPPGPGGMRPRGHGAFIKLKGPDGAEIAVRCADGDSTSECMDVVTQLIDKVKSMRPDRRIGRPGEEGGSRGFERGGERGYDRGGERYRDRDRE